MLYIYNNNNNNNNNNNLIFFPSSKVSSSNVQANAWLDVRVIYVRVSGCPLDDDAPESLTVRFPARSIGTALEVNGGRISPSEEALLVLRRDKIDTESAEATYVSTDNLRASGASVSYEVFNRDEALLSGTIEQQSEPRPPPADAANSTHQEWKMECNCVVGQSGCVFLKGRNDYPSMSLAPAPVVEVCVVGRFSGTPVILTRTVQMSARRRLNRQITLDAIPESEAVGRTSTSSLIAMDHQSQLVNRILPEARSPPYLSLSFGYGLEGSGYGESDGEMTWFNAGVRVGVGIGLGMCLGVGIGVGLMVRTYQATARTFRRGFF
ncbi:unnamed protein product [Sphagnum jensenii]|uniref:Uncharacterized protein n=1 Tax=Sphagnum jensenii TaxID=128206 RepID=A0ABP1BW46_9BRYO